MKKSIVWIMLVVVLSVFVSCTGKNGTTGPIGPAGPIQPGLYYVKNFQRGVYTTAYNGQVETSIYAGHSQAEYTSNTQTVWFGQKTGRAVNRAIIKFDLSSIPTSKIIVDKAQLILKTNGVSEGGGVVAVNVHKVTTNWTVNQTGWMNVSATTGWVDAYGGGDFEDNTITANVAAFNMTGDDTVTIDLDPAVVQSWTNSPATNYGMIFIAGAEATGNYVEIYPSGAVTPSNRPLLKVSYYTTE